MIFIFILLFSNFTIAFEDPTQGKTFFPWLWEDQLKPTIHNSIDDTGLTIFAAGALTTVFTHQYDQDIYEHNKKNKNLAIDRKTSTDLVRFGNGFFSVSLAVGQLFLDQENGLMHARALLLTSLSHLTLSYAVQRERPDHRGDFLPFPSAFPSGHAASVFATAGSIYYAYGWKVGLPAYLVATSVALARISENAHWASDITSGIALGAFWAHASYQTKKNSQEQIPALIPVPTNDGLAIYFYSTF